MDRCVSCQFYDRQKNKDGDGKAVQWGQCRRTAPALSPINAKAYMIEGVWPTVRDDDWCGEWKTGGPKRVEPRVGDVLTAPLTGTTTIGNPALQPRISPRPAATVSAVNPGLGPRALVGAGE